MLRNTSDLIDYTVQARDGEIGKIQDFYFDDTDWVLRYMVVQTGDWLSNRRVLISPDALEQLDWEQYQFSINLSRSDVEQSPDIDTAQPISRRQESRLLEYYQWPIYWSPGGLMAARDARRIAQKQEELERQTEQADAATHLRSTNEVSGYQIRARDGEVGHVEDFLIDDENWNINYLLVDTRNWLPGRKVIVAPAWIEQMSWATREVNIDLTQNTIRNSPEYDPSTPLNQAEEEPQDDS